MKKIISLFSLCLIVTINSYGQITVQESIEEKEVLKPIEFDSLTPFINKGDLNKYIGYKLYMFPISKKSIDTAINFLLQNSEVVYKLEHKNTFEESYHFSRFRNYKYEQLQNDDTYKILKERYESKFVLKTNLYKPNVKLISDNTNDSMSGESYNVTNISNFTNYHDVENKYYTIINITDAFGDDLKKPNYSNKERQNRKIDQYTIRVYLQDDISKDTLYFYSPNVGFSSIDIGQTNFILVPYFEKTVQLHKNKYYVAKRDFSYHQSNNDLNIKKNTIWKCTDVTLLQSNEYEFPTPTIILKDSDGNIINIPFGIDNKRPSISPEVDNCFRDLSSLCPNFIRYEVYLSNKEKQRLSIEEIHKKEVAEQAKIKMQTQKKLEDFRAFCISSYGNKYGNIIFNGKVCIGMNKEMCISAWGNPLDIYRTTVKNDVTEQWVYSYKHYLYFKNGILYAIQN